MNQQLVTILAGSTLALGVGGYSLTDRNADALYSAAPLSARVQSEKSEVNWRTVHVAPEADKRGIGSIHFELPAWFDKEDAEQRTVSRDDLVSKLLSRGPELVNSKFTKAEKKSRFERVKHILTKCGKKVGVDTCTTGRGSANR